MALSNIFREPRREITETVVGVTLAAPLIWADYKAAVWFEWFTGGSHDGSVAFAIGLFLISGAAVVIHTAGDIICDELEAHGIRLRPRR